MNPESQILVARLETMERQTRGWKILVTLSILLAAAAIALPILRASPAAPGRVTHSVIEANRFILRDPQGRACGGLEVAADGTLRLVLGRSGGDMGAAFLEVQRDASLLTLRDPNGTVRAALIGARNSSMALYSEGLRPTATVMTTDTGAGSILLSDGFGRPRFRAP